MPKSIPLGQIKLPVVDYAIQGNAILGIKESGKSYAATYLAERLLENKIPFVAFDPIGVWKYLRVAGSGPAYPVVVAGGNNGDLPLTPQSAPEIVRAAMRENVPLVIDLFTVKLSKADRRRIVETCVELLLYENGDHGLRHIFLEEAPQFAPQKIGPESARVYGVIEELCRMGGNAMLGYTLIGQRAEEVNKAVLELCDCLMLFRQKGRNSLTALGKWLKVAEVDESSGIAKTIPLLGTGECWVWPKESATPVRTTIPHKNSFHPDRRQMLSPSASGKFDAIDATQFVAKLSSSLDKYVAEAKANDPAELKRHVAALQKKVQQMESAKPETKTETKTELVEVPVISPDDYRQITEVVSHARTSAAQLRQIVESLENHAARIEAAVSLFKQPRPVQPPPRPASSPRLLSISAGPEGIVRFSSDAPADLVRGKRAILQALARCHPMKLSLPQLGRLAGQSLKSSSFKAYLSDAKRAGLVAHEHDGYALTDSGMAAIEFTPSLPQTADERIAMWRNALVAGERAIFDYVMQACPRAGLSGSSPRGEWVAIDDISAATGQSLKSSSFKAYISNLVRNRLLEKSADEHRPAEWLMKGD